MLIQPKWASKFRIKPGTWVFCPTEESKEYGTRIKKNLERLWIAPAYYYHHQRGGHVEALKSHTANTYFIHLDIRKFFNSINRSRITRSLVPLFGYDLAREIAINSTVKNPDLDGKRYMLPFGFVQSPLLASICLRNSKLGRVLHEIHSRDESVVSVYVDDIIISVKRLDIAEELLAKIKAASIGSGFALNDEKEEGPAKAITAFNILLSSNDLHVSEARNIEFSEICKSSNNANEVAGVIGYVESINFRQSIDLRAVAEANNNLTLVRPLNLK